MLKTAAEIEVVLAGKDKQHLAVAEVQRDYANKAFYALLDQLTETK